MSAAEQQLRDYVSAEWPELDGSRAEVRIGAFHTVVLPPSGNVLRLTTGHRCGQRARGEAATLQMMVNVALPVPIPHVLAGPVDCDHWSATLISRVPGTQTDDVSSADPERIQGYTDLLTAFRTADPAAIPGLPPPRTWCGGREWPDLVEHDLVPLLDRAARRSALARVTELLDTEDSSAGVICHGDFGPHNILWERNRPASLIDLDHACIGDPAIDLAPLIGFHGFAAIRPIAPTEMLRRAMIHRATLSLQVAAAAHLNGSVDLRDHALRNFTTRNLQGTLFDPTGLTPADLPDQRRN